MTEKQPFSSQSIIEGMFESNGVVDIALKTDIDPHARFISSDKPFNSPDGEATHPDDRAMGKYL